MMVEEAGTEVGAEVEVAAVAVTAIRIKIRVQGGWQGAQGSTISSSVARGEEEEAGGVSTSPLGGHTWFCMQAPGVVAS